jgi:hypothetical protein
MKRRADNESTARERVSDNLILAADELHREHPKNPRAKSLAEGARYLSHLIASKQEPAGFVQLLRFHAENSAKQFPELLIAGALEDTVKSYKSGRLRPAITGESITFPSAIECLKLAAIVREVARRLAISKVERAGSHALRLRKLARLVEERSSDFDMAVFEKTIDFVRSYVGDSLGTDLLKEVKRALKLATDGKTERWLQSFALRQWISAENAKSKQRAKEQPESQ